MRGFCVYWPCGYVMQDKSDNNEHKLRVQHQFGRSARDYATSDIHAHGESLNLLCELIDSQPTWRALDVATGAGHTALTIASHVRQVVASDITDAMLSQTKEAARSSNLNNVVTQIADAENLPFDDSSFDLLTCRLAFHHFPNPTKAVQEFARVLKPQARFGFTDNFTVESREAAEFYNRYERLRDPSHVRVLPKAELLQLFESNGFRIDDTRELSKEFEFENWADRQRVSDNDKQTLRQMMRKIPNELRPLFQPRWDDNTMYFTLWEIVVAATRI